VGTKHLQTGIALGVVLGLLSCGWHAVAQEGQKPPDGGGSGAATPEDIKAAEREALNKVAIEDPFKPRYIVEAIEVKGNEYTRGDLIISHLFLQPGESLDEEKVELSRIRLLALGYFKDVRMRLEKGSLRGRVKLIVEVEERNTWIVDDLFIGWSGSDPAWGGLGISDINFLGRGLVLSVAGVGSEHQWGARLGFFWPSVLGTSFQTGI
jgi:outer membrane protein assembly factor BamA